MGMLRLARSLSTLTVIAAVSLTAGYVLPRQTLRRGGDILDAVAAVERRCPLYLVAERGLPYNWAAAGGFYLSRTSKTAEELDRLLKDPRSYDSCWNGVIYFKACNHRGPLLLPFLPGPADRILDYGSFVVYGDPELVQEVRLILADQGFKSISSAAHSG
jgi:hypothetical protein